MISSSRHVKEKLLWGKAAMQRSGQTLPCCGAVHTMQCNAALLMQPCMTHYRVAAMLCCGFMSSLRLVSLTQSDLTVVSHPEEEASEGKSYRGACALDWLQAFSKSCWNFEKSSVSTRGITQSKLEMCPVPLSHTNSAFSIIFCFLYSTCFSCIGSFFSFWLIVSCEWQTKRGKKQCKWTHC